MVTFPTLRKCAALATGLTFLSLAACQKSDTSASSPTAPAAAPAASAAPTPVTPNSFNDVTAQLDPGGDLYFYLNTAQWLSKLSDGIDSIHDLVLSSTSDGNPQEKDEIEKVFTLVKDVAKKSGIEDLSGVGGSSFNYAQGLYRNKIFLGHDPAQGSGLIWSLYGKAPHALTGLDLLPADTGVGGFGDIDIAGLVNFLRQEAEGCGIPEAKDAVDQGTTQFAGVTGLQLDDVLNSLSGSMGTVVTLDATSTITIPVPNAPETIPTPRIALLIGVKSDLIFKRIDAMAGGNPGVIKVDEDGLSMRTMPVPLPFVQDLNLRPTVAQWNGYLVIASDDQIIREMIAVQKGAPGYKSTPEYAALSAGMPDQGNSFTVCSQRFVEIVQKLQGLYYANQPNVTPALSAFMQKLSASEYSGTGRMMTVGSVLPNGYLCVTQGAQGSSQVLAPLLVAPVAIIAGLAVPYFMMHSPMGP